MQQAYDGASEVSIGHALAQNKIIHDVLQYCKVSSRWMPRHLIPDHKSQRMGTRLQHLLWLCYKMEGNVFLFQTVIRDESWVHNFVAAKFKAASMAWKHISPVRKKFKIPPLTGKVLLTVF